MQTARMFLFLDWSKNNKRKNKAAIHTGSRFLNFCLCMIMFHGVVQFLVEIQEEELVKTEK